MRLVCLSPDFKSIGPWFLLSRECIFSFRHIIHIESLEFQLTFRTVELEHLLDHPVQWCIGKQVLLALLQSITTSDITMVTSKPLLLEVNRWTILIHHEQRWLEFQSSLMNGHCVSDVSSWRISNHLIGRAIQRNFELANAVDTIEQPKEVDSNIRPAKSLVEILHVILQFFVLFGLGNVAAGLLEAAEGVPSKSDHLLITLGQKTKFMDHLSEKSCCIRTARETKNIDMISRLVITHDKPVTRQKVLMERRSNHLVQCGDKGGFDLRPKVPARCTVPLTFDICTNTSCQFFF